MTRTKPKRRTPSVFVAKYDGGACPLCGRRVRKGDTVKRVRYRGEGALYEHNNCAGSNGPVVVTRAREPEPALVPSPSSSVPCSTCHLVHQGDCF